MSNYQMVWNSSNRVRYQKEYMNVRIITEYSNALVHRESHSNALDLESGICRWKEPVWVALYLKLSVEASKRGKTTPSSGTGKGRATPNILAVYRPGIVSEQSSLP